MLFPNSSSVIVSFSKHWIPFSLLHFINLFLLSNIFLLYITSGSSIFKLFVLKFSYSISGFMISAISVPSLLLLVSPTLDIVLESPENELMLFVTFLFVFTCSKVISSRYSY